MKIILIALLLAVLFSGCVESNPLSGNTYIGPDGDIIRFFEDGKMHYTTAKGMGITGTYFIEENRVYFNTFYHGGDAEIMDTELHFGADVYVLIEQ